MSCARYHQLMSRYVDGEVTLRQRQELLQHVESCPDCAAWLARLRQADVLLKGVPEARPSDKVRNAVLHSVRQAAPAQPAARVPLVRTKSGLRLNAMGLLLRFDPSPRRVALLVAVIAAALTSLGYYTNVLPPLWGYNKLGFEVSSDAAIAEVNVEPIAAISSGYNGLGGPVAVPNPVRVTPEDASRDVALKEALRVRFDLPMDRPSVERALFIDPPVAGAFAWDADNDVRYSPHEPGLLRGITYTVTLSNSARSLQGIPLKAPLSWSFRTREPHSVSPGLPAGSTIFPTSTLTLVFDAPMDKADVARNLSLRLQSKIEAPPGHSQSRIEDVPMSLLWDKEGLSLTVAPSGPLAEGQVYLGIGSTSKTLAGETLGQPVEVMYDVALPRPRLRLLGGRVAVAPAQSPVPVRYEALGARAAREPGARYAELASSIGRPDFALYRLTADHLSALGAQSHGWPRALPAGFPRGEALGGLSVIFSEEDEAGRATAHVGGLQPGIYLLVATTTFEAGTLTDWQVLVVADRELTLTSSAGPLWATDEAGHVWSNAETSLYSPEGTLLEKGLTNEHGLWLPSDKLHTTSLIIAQDLNGHIAAILPTPTSNPINPKSKTQNLKSEVTLQTDQPQYRPGHVVHFRALLHGAVRAERTVSQPPNAPRTDESALQEQEVSVLLLGPQGSELSILTLKPDRLGGVSGIFNLSPDLKPGTYVVRVRSGTLVAADQDFPIQVKPGASAGDTLSVLIVPTPQIAADMRSITSTVSVLGQTGEAAAGTLLTATLRIAGDLWKGQPVTATTGTDGRANLVVPLPAWLETNADPGLYLRVDAGRVNLRGSDSYYLDLTSASETQAGIGRMVSPQLGVSVVSQPITDGVSIEVTELLVDSEEGECCASAMPVAGDLLVLAEATSGERFAQALSIGAQGAALMLPAQFAGGTLRFFRAGVPGSREMTLMPAWGGEGMALNVSVSRTVVANSRLDAGLNMLDAEGQRVPGIASVWLRPVSGASYLDSLPSWHPSIELQAAEMTTATLQAPGEPGLWYVMAEGIAPDGSFARSWSVVRVLPGPVLQLPPAQSAVVDQPQSLSALVYNPGDESLTTSLVASGAGGVSVLGGPQTVEVKAGSWQRVSWRFAPERQGSSNLVFTSMDGFPSVGRQTLNVSVTKNPRTDITYSSGAVGSERTVGVQVPSGLSPDAVQLEVRASTSLLSALASVATDLAGEPVEANEGVAMAASLLSAPYSVAAAYHRTDSRLPPTLALPNVERSMILQQLYSAQHADGGWGAYLDGSSPSTITDTAQVLVAMRRHNIASIEMGLEAQPQIDAAVIKRGLAYLFSEVSRPLGTEVSTAMLDARARGLYVLSLYGQLEPQWARSFIAHASNAAQKRDVGLSPEGQAWLALALWHAGYADDAAVLVDRLVSVHAEGRQVASAPLLESLLVVGGGQREAIGNPSTPTYKVIAGNVARAMMEARQGSGWDHPTLTADAVWALSLHAIEVRDKPGASSPLLMLDNRALQAPAQSDDPATLSLVLAGDTLHAGTSWLKLKASGANQTLYYSLTLMATR